MAAKKSERKADKADKSEKTHRAEKADRADKGMSKTAFVRSLPKDMSAKDVVEKAKAAGFEISEAYIYSIRSSTKRGSKKTGASKGDGRQRSDGSSSKRQFIESLPADMPPSQVVKAARENGLDLSVNYVYVVRRGQKPGSTGSSRAEVRSARGLPTGGHSSEARFVDLVAQIGLERAAALLDAVRGKLRSIRVE